MTALGYVDLILGAAGIAFGGYILVTAINMLIRSKADAQHFAAAGCGCMAMLAGSFTHAARLLVVYGAGMIVIHILMIAAGVGVLRLAPWARTLSLAVAGLFLVSGGGVIGAAYSVPVIVLMMKPEWKAAFSQVQTNTAAAAGSSPKPAE